MSVPRLPDDVKLISSVFSSDEKILKDVLDLLDEELGPLDKVSKPVMFDKTRYYEKEMGWPLYRRFVSFAPLIRPEDLVEIKLKTNDIEKRYMYADKRLVNIDPGIISAERLILATGKNYTHRIYLYQGIYADLTLVYIRGSFRPLEWTYPDYREDYVIDFFNSIRQDYLKSLEK